MNKNFKLPVVKQCNKKGYHSNVSINRKVSKESCIFVTFFRIIKRFYIGKVKKIFFALKFIVTCKTMSE